MKKIIASNFKTNHTRASTKEYVNQLNSFIVDHNIDNTVFVFPPLTALDSYNLKGNIHIGVQNASSMENGSLTGEVGLEQIKEFGVQSILIGHSERRHTLAETQDEIVKKFTFYKQQGFEIVYCIGEPLSIKEQGVQKVLEYLDAQLEGIDTSYEKLTIAYEPVWAIGTGVSAQLEDIQAVHTQIKKTIQRPLLYGGSVKCENLQKILELEHVDGVLVGTASWSVNDFIKMIEIAQKIN